MNDDGETISELLRPLADISQFTRTGNQQPVIPTEDEDDVAFAHGRIGPRPRMMLAFRRCNGEVEVFPYSMLSRIHSEDTDTGFTLTFGPRIVQVTGRNLTQLFRYICEHRAAEINEADRTTALTTQSAAVVTQIRIENKSPQ
ncbi:MAG: hypothetical protein R3C59_10935 [Planctomycetaceae bacterium]